jgi:hypothetical protein
MLFKFILVLGLSILPAIKSKYVGTDSQMYVGFFSLHQTYSEWLSNGTEPAFVSSIKLLQFLGADNYFYFFLFFSLIFNYLIVNSIFKLSKNIPLSLLIFLSYSALYIFHFNVLRQSMAVAFVIFSLRYLFTANYLKFYMVVAIASLFHYSAICTVTFPILLKILNSRPLVLYAFTFIILICFSYTSNQIYVLLSSATKLVVIVIMLIFQLVIRLEIIFLNVMLLFIFIALYCKFKIKDLQDSFFLYLFFTSVVINFLHIIFGSSL